MSRRVGQEKPSTVMVGFRLTEKERDEWHALAQEIGESLSDLVRRLMDEERARVKKKKRQP